MPRKKNERAAEQVVVYLDDRDSRLLAQMVRKSGLAKTELFRRGLRRLSEDVLGAKRPGSSLRYLLSTAAEDEFPPDVSSRPDEYLYGGEYQKPVKRKRARTG